MSLISSPSDVAPRVRLAPPAARNDAELVVELAAAYGTVFDPWQIDVLEAGCGVRDGRVVGGADGRVQLPAAERQERGPDRPGAVRVRCSRREGDHLSAPMSRRPPGCCFRTLLGFFENYDDLGRRVSTVGRALGREEIGLRSGTHPRLLPGPHAHRRCAAGRSTATWPMRRS